MDYPDSTVLSKGPCSACGSSDANALYDDGHSYCFSCLAYEGGSGEGPATVSASARRPVPGLLPLGPIPNGIASRKLSAETCRKWGVTYGSYRGAQCLVYNYRRPDGAVVAQKIRTPDKDFAFLGDTKDAGLYGKHLWGQDSKRVTITEGEMDALAVSQAYGNKWPVVSIPNGAAHARKALANDIDWLSKFDEIVLCFDMDDPGQQAVEECVTLFKPGKVRVVNLPRKDACDMLIHDEVGLLVSALWEANPYRPDGIVTIGDIEDDILVDPEMGLSWFLPTLTERTYGRRYGELVGVGAGTGIGKSTFLAQQIAHDHNVLKLPVGVFAFEQMPKETVKRVAGQIAGQTFHIPDGDWTREQLSQQVKQMKGGAPLYLYNHFGACNWETVRERIRYLRHAHDVRLFFIDNLTALAEASEYDEQSALREIMADLGALVVELDCWILYVSHLATPDGASHEEGGRVAIRHFKGSRAIGFWSHFMFGLERDQQSDDPSERQLTTLRVLKDRFTGQSTGFTQRLYYDQSTGRLSEEDNSIFANARQANEECPF